MNSQLLKNIQTLLKTKDESAYLMIDFMPFYIQLSRGTAPNKIYLQSPGNAHIKKDKQLSESQVQEMIKNGLTLHEKSKDFVKEFTTPADTAQIIAELVEKMIPIYGGNPAKLDMDLVLDD
jgi:hypothetical protein